MKNYEQAMVYTLDYRFRMLFDEHKLAGYWACMASRMRIMRV